MVYHSECLPKLGAGICFWSITVIEEHHIPATGFSEHDRLSVFIVENRYHIPNMTNFGDVKICGYRYEYISGWVALYIYTQL